MLGVPNETVYSLGQFNHVVDDNNSLSGHHLSKIIKFSHIAHYGTFTMSVARAFLSKIPGNIDGLYRRGSTTHRKVGLLLVSYTSLTVRDGHGETKTCPYLLLVDQPPKLVEPENLQLEL